MDRKKIFKILYRIVSVLLFITVSFCSILSSCEGVLAADLEINSLPVDIDIDVEYTSDSISLKYLNNTYIINRNTPIDLVGTGYYEKNYYSPYPKDFYYSLPVDFEHTYTTSSLLYTDASYWFSPSELKVYVLTSPFYVRSSYKYKFNSVLSFSSGSDYGYFSFSTNGLSEHFYVYISVLDLSTYSLSLGRKYVTESEGYNCYGCLDDPDNEVTCYFPNDLVCIFSNYAISGFYEPDTSKVNTPDYYFDNEYIFYSEGNGYTFVD
ncbi:MAG: hypothetical protein ACI4EW_08715, partial [Butyrivibrio sp.]